MRASLSPPSPRLAASLNFLFLCEIVEFRVRGGNQRLVRIIIEHHAEWNHFDFRFGAGLPDEIDRANGVSREIEEKTRRALPILR